MHRKVNGHKINISQASGHDSAERFMSHNDLRDSCHKMIHGWREYLEKYCEVIKQVVEAKGLT